MRATFPGGSPAVWLASARLKRRGSSRSRLQRLEWKCRASACNLLLMPSGFDLGDRVRVKPNYNTSFRSGHRLAYAPSMAASCETRIGASGWHYKHWRGPFYPEKLPAPKMLEFYTRHFDTVELNNTFYRLPPVTRIKTRHDSTPTH